MLEVISAMTQKEKKYDKGVLVVLQVVCSFIQGGQDRSH